MEMKMEIRAKVSSLVCQLGALGYPCSANECSFEDGDCAVFLDVIMFVLEYFWDCIGEDVVRLNRKCIPASWLSGGCFPGEEGPRRIIHLLFGEEQRRRESFRRVGRICRTIFDMKMPLGEDQFVRKGFVVKKMDIVLDILKHLREMQTKGLRKCKDTWNTAVTTTTTKTKKKNGAENARERCMNHSSDDDLHARKTPPHDFISSDPSIYSFLNRTVDPLVEEDPVDMFAQHAMQHDPVGFGEFLMLDHLHHDAMDDDTWLSNPSTHAATINPLFSSSPISKDTSIDGGSCLHRLEDRIRNALAALQQVSMHCE